MLDRLKAVDPRRWALLWLLLAVGAWSVVAVAQSNRSLLPDPSSNVLPALELRRALSSLEPRDWRVWIDSTMFRPPLPAVAYQPAMRLVGDQVLAVKLTDVLVFLGCIWFTFRLGARLCGRTAGLLAALIFAASPLALAWSRAGNADPLIWFGALLMFRVTLDVDLRSWRGALLLGLTVGLCLGTRLLLAALIAGPLLWVVGEALRRWRSAIKLPVAGAVALAVPGWWIVAQWEEILFNLHQSHTQAAIQLSPEDASKLGYLFHDYGWLLACAVVAGIAVAGHRLLPRRQQLLFAVWILASALQFGLLWDYWERYLIGLIPVGALLIATALDRLTRPWPPRRRVLALSTMAALMGVNLAQYMLFEHMPHQLEGTLVPDRRIYGAARRAVASVPDGERVVLACEEWDPRVPRIELARRWPPRVELLHPPDADDLLGLRPHQRVRYLLHVGVDSARCRTDPCAMPSPHPWWRRTRANLELRVVRRARDPDGRVYTLFELPAPRTFP